MAIGGQPNGHPPFAGQAIHCEADRVSVVNCAERFDLQIADSRACFTPCETRRKIDRDAKRFDLLSRSYVNFCCLETERVPGAHTFIVFVWISSVKSKNSLHLIPLAGVLASLAIIFVPYASANDGLTPGWRKGFSSWNGSSYDLPEKVPSPWGTSDPSSVDNEIDFNEMGVNEIGANADQSSVASRKPYTVPEGPQSNPYFGPVPEMTLPLAGKSAPSQDRSQTQLDQSSDLFSTLISPDASISPEANGGSATTETVETPAKPSASETDSTPTGLAPPANSPATSTSIRSGSDPSQPTGDSKPNGDGKSDPASDKASPPATQSAETSVDSTQNKLSEPAIETMPLEHEIIRWYQYPRRWMKGWNSHAEFGIDGSDGNANTLAIQTGLDLRRQTEFHTLAIDIDYRQANSRNVTTENNG